MYIDKDDARLPATLRKAWGDLELYTTIWGEGASPIIEIEWTLEDLTSHNMTDVVSVPWVVEKAKGNTLSRTVCFYIGAVNVVTMTYRGSQTLVPAGQKNFWALSHGIICKYPKGGTPELLPQLVQ